MQQLAVHNPVENRGRERLKASKFITGHPISGSVVVSPRQRKRLVENFRVHSPRRAELLLLRYPDQRHSSPGGGESWRTRRLPQPDDASRKCFLSYVAAPSFFSDPSTRRLIHRFPREKLQLWPSSAAAAVAGAAILPDARWFTEICGWGHV